MQALHIVHTLPLKEERKVEEEYAPPPACVECAVWYWMFPEAPYRIVNGKGVSKAMRFCSLQCVEVYLEAYAPRLIACSVFGPREKPSGLVYDVEVIDRERLLLTQRITDLAMMP
jgi:hypothetical protein